MKLNRLIAVALGLVAGIASWADQPFRDHRYDSFKVTPTESGQIVFAGNSITNMHSWFEAFGSHQEVIGRGNSGGFAYELLDNLESYIDGKPAKFFVMIGTNDVSSGQSAEITARRIETIVRRVRLESPETEVYVQSILPRSANAKPDYEQCNSMVSEWVAQLADPKVSFINLSEVCAPINGNGTWSHDGLHPRPIGYAAWTHAIESQVGYPSVYPATISSQNSCGLGGSSAARAEQFPYFPVMEGDVLFFGDEQVHGAEWHELFRSAKIKDRGMQWGWGGINLTQAKNVVRSALKDQAVKPAKIFLFYGIGGTDETNYRALVDEAKAQAPAAGIYLVSLSPSTNANTDADRVSFNSVMQTVAEEKGATYVDVYTPLKANISANIMNTNYISGRGYIVMANALAPYLAEEGVNPVTVEEADAVYARRNARKIIGDALTNAMMLNYGSGLGQIDEANRAAVEALIPAAAEAVNDPELTAEKAQAAIVDLNAAVAAAQQALNMPEASTEGHDVWYTLTSARGTVSTLTVSGGKLIGGNAPGERSDGSNVWKFVAKDENSFYIINPNGEYLSPTAAHNSQLNAVTSAPSKGWQLGASDAASGAYVIYTNNCQLNQTNQANAVFNWYGTATPNRADQGCAYYISLYEGEIGEPEPIVIPDPVVTLLNREFDGTAPFRVPDVLAAPVLASEANTCAIDVTISEPTTDFAVFAAATCTTAPDQFFTIGQISGGRVGVRYVGEQGTEGWYTRAPSNTTTMKFVVVNDPEGGYNVYTDGANIMSFAPASLGAYGHKHFGNVDDADAIYLGGFVTSDEENKYPLNGTIRSARFWNCALTPEQVAALEYDGLTESEVDSITEIAPAPSAADAIYDLQGRRVVAPSRGLYIVNGQKVRL